MLRFIPVNLMACVVLIGFQSACGGNSGGNGNSGNNNPPPVSTITTIDGNSLITINAKSNDLVWDSSHQVLYAAISHESHNYQGTISALDPLTGRVNTSASVSQEGSVLAISDDNQFLYVGIDPTSVNSTQGGYVQRYILPALTPDIQIPLGTQPSSLGGLPYYPLALAVVPGASHSIALVKGAFMSGLTNFAEDNVIEIYDDQQARPKNIDGYPFNGLFIAWGYDASTLFVSDPIPDLYVLGANASGVTNITTQVVTLGGSLGFLSPPLPARIFFRNGDGYVYTSQGVAVDPTTGQHVISYVPNELGLDSLFVTFYPDATVGQVYFVQTLSPPGCVFGQCNTVISTLNKSDAQSVNSISFNAMDYPPVVLTRWGSKGLAFTTNSVRLDGYVNDFTAGKIFILQGPLVAP